MRSISILGSTGSVGDSTLKLLRQHRSELIAAPLNSDLGERFPHANQARATTCWVKDDVR